MTRKIWIGSSKKWNPQANITNNQRNTNQNKMLLLVHHISKSKKRKKLCDTKYWQEHAEMGNLIHGYWNYDPV